MTETISEKDLQKENEELRAELETWKNAAVTNAKVLQVIRDTLTLGVAVQIK